MNKVLPRPLIAALVLLLLSGAAQAATSVSKGGPLLCFSGMYFPELYCRISGTNLTCDIAQTGGGRCAVYVVLDTKTVTAPATLNNIWFANPSGGIADPEVICVSSASNTYCYNIDFISTYDLNGLFNIDVDTDSDGIGNNADWDDDNDGVPDNIDVAPLNAGNTSEITLPVDGVYKGSLLKNQGTGQ